MITPKITKYIAISGLVGFCNSLYCHYYVTYEDILAQHTSATIAGIQSDIATAWGYVPPSPPPPPQVDPDSLPVRELLDAASERHGVNPALTRAVASVESSGNQEAQSGKGAIGLLQVMPSSAKRCGIQPHKLWRESINADCGVKILKEELLTYKGDLIKALKAYNGGHKCVINRCDESEKYVVKVLATLGSQMPALVASN